MAVKKGLRITAIVGSVVLLLGLVAYAVAPRYVSNYVKDEIIAEAGKAGVNLEIGDLSVRPGYAHFEDLCVFGPGDFSDERIVCFDELEVWFDQEGGMTSTDIKVRQIAAGTLTVSLNREIGELDAIIDSFVELAESLAPEEREREAKEPRDPDAPPEVQLEVSITRLEVDVAGQDLPLDGVHLTEFLLTKAGPTWTLTANGQLPGIEVPDEVAIDGDTVLHIAIAGENPESFTATVSGDAPIRINPASGVRVDVNGFHFRAPYHVGAEGVTVLVAGQDEPVFESPSFTLTLRELTTDPEDFYMASLDMVAPTIHLALDEDGVPEVLHAFGVTRSELNRADEDPGLETQVLTAYEDPDAEPAVEPAQGHPETGDDDVDEDESWELWSDRLWWEKVPQLITMRDASITISQPDGSFIELDSMDLDYALRIFNFQLDIDLEASLTTHAGGETSVIDIGFVWGWTRSNANFDLRLTELPLGALIGLGTDGDPPLDGRLTLDTSFRESANRDDIAWEGEVQLTDLTLETGLLESAIVVPSLSYVWEADRHREQDEETGEMLRGPLRFTRGDVTLGAASAQFRMNLYDFNYRNPGQLSAIEFLVDVPDQDAQTLFDAVPAAVWPDLTGTQLAGEWGFTSHFRVDMTETEDGQPDIEIDAPYEYDVRDDTLELVSLPEAVDVRRMNDAFEFTFLGPDGEINRPLSVPAPASLLNAPEAGPERAAYDEARASDEWANLDEISWYLIACQTYREDGRFFTNRGVNWYQIRRVLEEAFRERTFGRGASTITMQTVKNVFLSHERSLERKLTELFLTYWMTRLVPKERILEVYLNIIEWGPGVNGIIEAADYYFGKTPLELSLSEAVWLSAITPAPQRRSAQRAEGQPPEWMQRRVRDLIEGLEGRGLITRAEMNKGLTEEIYFVGAERPDGPRPGNLDPDAEGPLFAPAPVAGSEAEPSEILQLEPEDRVRLWIEEGYQID